MTLRIVMFYHSLRSDWRHGNAHFLRGVASELQSRGHQVSVYEPRDAWSVRNLIAERGLDALVAYRRVYPSLRSTRYDLTTLDLDSALEGADLVFVHDWNDLDLVRRIGEHRRRSGGYRLLFHDTHHRPITETERMAAYDLRFYDGVLAFGGAIRDMYLARGWAERAWIWHQAADVRVFHPRDETNERDLVSDVNRAVTRVREAHARLRDAAGATGDTLEKVRALEAKLLTPPVRYSTPGLQAHITYLYGMTNQADQKVGRDAKERYAVLRRELDGLVAQLNQLLGPDRMNAAAAR